METTKMKLELFREIDQLNDENLRGLYNLVARQKTKSEDFWETLSPLEKEDIEKGISDLEEGRVKELSVVLEKYN